jgi:hypothetical protein
VFSGSGRDPSPEALLAHIPATDPAASSLEPLVAKVCRSNSEAHRYAAMQSKKEVRSPIDLLCELGSSWNLSVTQFGSATAPAFRNSDFLLVRGADRNVMEAVVKSDGSFMRYDSKVCKAEEPRA